MVATAFHKTIPIRKTKILTVRKIVNPDQFMLYQFHTGIEERRSEYKIDYLHTWHGTRYMRFRSVYDTIIVT